MRSQLVGVIRGSACDYKKTARNLLKETDACSLTAAKLVSGTGFIYYALLGEKGIGNYSEKRNGGSENLRLYERG